MPVPGSQSLASTRTTPLAPSLRRVATMPLRERVRQPVYWAWVRFVVLGRGVPAVLFGYLGWIQLNRAATAAQASTDLYSVVSDVLPTLLYTAFCSIPVVIYLTRPMPTRRDTRLLPRLAAFTGTTMQLLVGAFFPRGDVLFTAPDWIADLSPLLLILAFSYAILGLAFLRRNLSIVPEARRLVTTGPYRLSRHPLYTAEILAAAALLVPEPHLVPAVALAIFVGMQVLRARYEERLLAATFPEYAGYARRTRRLIPFVW